MTVRYRAPLSGQPLKVGRDGNLYDAGGELAFENHEGSYDFVVDEHSRKERAFYESTYSDGGWWASDESLDAVDYGSLWAAEPGAREYLKSVGDLRGKKILLIGNGTSVKEFMFVGRGAQVTFTDLSFQGVLYAKVRYRASKLGGDRPEGCEFHAVNANHLPFADEAFDIVCADAVVHHMDDMKSLLSGIKRCLKPGGVCRFLDTAYSPLWQQAKKGLLRPLQKRVHRKQGISPEDRKATRRGGYHYEELEQLRAELGFKSLHYRRVALLDYLLWRARCKLDAPWVLAFRPLIRALDWLLSKTPIMQNQGVALVFGFDK
jgi:SAM-dependent methyltransferase